jgi:hypothetical protein
MTAAHGNNEQADEITNMIARIWNPKLCGMPRQSKHAALTVALAMTVMLNATVINAASVPNTFVPGTPASAAAVNENFQALVDSLTTVEGAGFDGYGISPSPSGVLGSRSVVVYDNGGCYIARGLFTNTTSETVDTPSGAVTPAFIWVWQSLCGDNSNVTYENEYIYALPAAGDGSPDWLNALGISISEDSDGDGTFDLVGSYNYAFESNITPLANLEIHTGGDVYLGAANDILTATNWGFIRSAYPRPLVVNGMTFNDVVVDRFIGADDRMRYRANGVGTILELRGNMNADPLFNPLSTTPQTQRPAIFYRRSDGTTDGSAAGTPYANGSTDMINKWFTE